MRSTVFTKALIGMVHVGALPGSPGHRRALHDIVLQAAREATVLVDAGFDAVMIENMHDRPYATVHGPEVTAAMTSVALAVRDSIGDLPLGVQVLSNGEREAMAVALAAGASFIRCENFVFSHVGDEGLMARAAAPDLLRYRRQVGAEHVMVFADVQKKHASHAVTADLGIGDLAKAAEFFLADGVIVTGVATGEPASLKDVAEVRGAVGLPVLVGSGVEPGQLGDLFAYSDALIVGSWIKRGGRWGNPVDAKRARAIVKAADRVRRG
ncbi:MAG: BtpA/SgcQ family protein [Phycisphaerales bacterium]